MKILLMSPLSVNQYIRYPYLGLGYLASSLRTTSHKVFIFGFKPNEYTDDNFIRFLKKNTPDVIGMTIYSADVFKAMKTLKLIKEFNPSIKTIVGGPHPSGEPAGTLNDLKSADFGFCGEGENGLPVLLDMLENKHFELDSVSGLIWRENGKIIVNPPSFVQDLDVIGMPAWDLMPPENSPGVSFNYFYKHPMIAPISATRGCPYLCTYCTAWKSNGRKVRKRSVPNIIKEIIYLYEKHGIREIQIMDSNFTLDNRLVRSFCEELIALNLKISWSCPNGVRLDSLDYDLLKLMRQSGCYLLNVGIETGSQRIMDSIKKNISISSIEKKVDMINRAGIFVLGFFMFGFPGEKMEDIKKTLELSYRLKLQGASYSILAPLPGSELYDKIEKKDFNWASFDFGHDAGINYEVPFETLKRIRTKAYLKFYLRPVQFTELLKFSMSFKRLYMVYKFIIRVLR